MRRFIPFVIPSGSSPAVKTQTKSATITANGGSVTVEPDSGFLLSAATVTADIPTEEKTLTVTENGNYTITPSAGKLMTKAMFSVNVPTGGGIPGSIAALEYGTFVSSTDVNGETAHTLTPSIRPDLLVVFSSEVSTANYTIVSALIQTYNSPSGVVKIRAANGSQNGTTGGIMSYSDNKVNLINITSARWRTYLTYHYIIIQLTEIPTAVGDPPQTVTSEPGIML